MHGDLQQGFEPLLNFFYIGRISSFVAKIIDFGLFLRLFNFMTFCKCSLSSSLPLRF